MSEFSKLFTSVFGDCSGHIEEPPRFFDSGTPTLNKIISGSYKDGFPHGKLVEIFGPSSSGKTLLATQIMIQAQRQGGYALFMDHELAFSRSLAEALGLDISADKFAYAAPPTWEDSHTRAFRFIKGLRTAKDGVRMIPEEAPIVVVFDSIAAMVPQSMAAKVDAKTGGLGFESYNMSDTTALARVASTTLKTVKAHAHDLRATVVYLNQMRQKPGVIYGENVGTTGGTATEYFADLRLRLTPRSRIDDKDKHFVGQKITIKAVKNKLTRPFQECSLLFMTPEDGLPYFDAITPIVDELIEKGKIPKSGAWLEWKGEKMHKATLIEKVRAEDDLPALATLLEEAVTTKE